MQPRYFFFLNPLNTLWAECEYGDSIFCKTKNSAVFRSLPPSLPFSVDVLSISFFVLPYLLPCFHTDHFPFVKFLFHSSRSFVYLLNVVTDLVQRSARNSKGLARRLDKTTSILFEVENKLIKNIA